MSVFQQPRRFNFFNPAESRFNLASKKGQGTGLSKIMDGKNDLEKWSFSGIFGHSWTNILLLIRRCGLKRNPGLRRGRLRR